MSQWLSSAGIWTCCVFLSTLRLRWVLSRSSFTWCQCWSSSRLPRETRSWPPEDELTPATRKNGEEEEVRMWKTINYVVMMVLFFIFFYSRAVSAVKVETLLCALPTSNEVYYLRSAEKNKNTSRSESCVSSSIMHFNKDKHSWRNLLGHLDSGRRKTWWKVHIWFIKRNHRNLSLVEYFHLSFKQRAGHRGHYLTLESSYICMLAGRRTEHNKWWCCKMIAGHNLWQTQQQVQTGGSISASPNMVVEKKKSFCWQKELHNQRNNLHALINYEGHFLDR